MNNYFSIYALIKNNKIKVSTQFLLLFLLSILSWGSKGESFDIEPMSLTDEVDVNILSGQAQFNIKTLEIGTLMHVIRAETLLIAPIDNYSGSISAYNARLWVDNIKCQKSVHVDNGIGGGLFCFDGSKWLNARKEPSSLTQANNDYVYTDSNGDKFYFSIIDSSRSPYPYYDTTIMKKIEKITGEIITVHHKIIKDPEYGTFYRIKSVNSSLGYQLKYEYPSYNIKTVTKLQFRAFSKIIGINSAKQYCSTDEDVICNITNFNWPVATFNYNSASYTYTIKDYLNRTHSFEHVYKELRPVISKYSNSFFTREYTHDNTWSMVGEVGSVTPPAMIVGKYNLVMKVTQNGRTWLYSYQTAGPYGFESKSVNSEGQALTVLSSTVDNGNNPVRVNQINGSIYNMDYNINTRLNNVITSDGYKIIIDYDSRGNVIQKERFSSSLSSTFTKANYDSDCENEKTCNKPNWTEDAKLGKTYYSYYSSGLKESVTSPSNRDNLTHETRYFYTSLFPYSLGATGQAIKATKPVWVIDKEITCRSSNPNGELCSKSGDEIITTYEYDNNGVVTNLQPIGKVISASGIEKRWCYEYDIYGSVISEIKPLANLASCQ